MSFADDRRLIELAKTGNSREQIAELLGGKPESITKAAKRLGISLKSKAKARVKRQ